MILYVIRHGQTESNRNKAYNVDEEDINETGIAQATELKEKIKDIDYDVIISSPLLRTKHTANICNAKNKKIIFDDRLKERDAGEFKGKSVTNTNREDFWNYNINLKYEYAESVKDVFKRVFSFIENLKQQNYKSVLIVTHSGVSKAFSAYFEGIGDGMFLTRGLQNCQIKKYLL